MKQTLLFFINCVSLFILAGCATSYHSSGFAGGFSDTQFAPDAFRVVFRGNGYTSAERVQDFALLRASELTIQHGFTCFAIIDESDTTRTSSYTTPGYANTTASVTGSSSGDVYLNPYGGTYSGTSSAYVNANTTYTPPQTYVFYKPQTGIMFRCFQTKPEGIFTYDATFLDQSLKQKYHIK